MRTIRLSLLSLIPVVALFAQADRGSVVGTVTDPSGGFVAGVSFTAMGPREFRAPLPG
jgi:hypothetical protein